MAGNHKRNPWRVLPIEKAEAENIGADEIGSEISSQVDAMGETEVEPLLGEGVFRQTHSWLAHKDVIKSIIYISQTDAPLIFTASLDKMAKIWVS